MLLFGNLTILYYLCNHKSKEENMNITRKIQYNPIMLFSITKSKHFLVVSNIFITFVPDLRRPFFL